MPSSLNSIVDWNSNFISEVIFTDLFFSVFNSIFIIIFSSSFILLRRFSLRFTSKVFDMDPVEYPLASVSLPLILISPTFLSISKSALSK